MDWEVPSEFLANEEPATITGYQAPSRQIQWLSHNGWEYVLTGARSLIVGRVYARLMLSGVKPSVANEVAETCTLDLSRVR
ncbi:DUF4224 domain-containing protein [Pseudomonas sp. LP_7_YM]|uniref:DUF4224 domain-containing protein n=1 Tax=Pseudomonas sp. LP_7_YM TaxID=2485137 RepID=UPI0010605467|nr:DUF4224 domain-containing protein [Pseudomonas sp. LP_7_YM]TDV67473.1 uncharacterized protein DUF4224 [Pseudomonas sp. LP_7_YM]